MPGLRRIEAGLPFLDRRCLRGEERLGIEIVVVGLLDAKDDVLNGLVVRVVRRDERLPRRLGLCVAASEIAAEIVDRQTRRRERGGGAGRAACARQRSAEVDGWEISRTHAAEIRLREACIE